MPKVMSVTGEQDRQRRAIEDDLYAKYSKQYIYKIWLSSGEVVTFEGNRLVEKDGELMIYQVDLPPNNFNLIVPNRLVFRSRDWASYSIEEIDEQVDVS